MIRGGREEDQHEREARCRRCAILCLHVQYLVASSEIEIGEYLESCDD